MAVAHDLGDLHLALERLSSLFRSQLRERASEHELKLVQLEALIYFGSANRYSDTAGALAEYLGVTKGTASQTVKALERRGLVSKRADANDGRVAHVALSAEGRAIAKRAHPAPFLENLGASGRDAAGASAKKLLRTLQAAHDFRGFGQCRTCRLHETHGASARCGLTGERLSKSDALRICREHEPV